LNTGHVVAVVVAAVGAVLFGLSAVRQHHEVQAAVSAHHGLRHEIRAFWGLLRHPSWLFGALQGTVGAALHVVALALAPITLVQPIGVIAVPVTVVASALRTRRPPSRSQVLGSVLSVVGVAVLTVLLLAPKAEPVVLPSWVVVAVTVLVLVGISVLATVTRGAGSPVLRCIALATAAAVLFGLNSILIRMVGHVLSTGSIAGAWPVLLAAVLGLGLSLPTGLWAMQTAYLSGSPHVVICCLTLVDPISAVIGGHLLLQDGVDITGLRLGGAVFSAVVAAAGVLLLSRNYPDELPHTLPTTPV
jgi:hypothetical protein